MKLINVTNRNRYVAKAGVVSPGRMTPDMYDELCDAMQKVVDMCGNNFGIILNDAEAALVEKIVSLDELGEKFDVKSIPAEIRNDPYGKKRASEMAKNSQRSAIEAERKANRAAARREAVINGEIDEKPRKPVGLATMEGEEVKPEMLKSGFEAILAENQRIAAEKGKKRANVQEMLDPIGAHMKKGSSATPAPAENDGTGLGDAQPVRQARNMDGDAVRTADANIPAPGVAERANAMDRQASDIARKLSMVGPEPTPDVVGVDVGNVRDLGLGDAPAAHEQEPEQLKEPEELKEQDQPEQPEQPEQPAKQPRGRKSVKKGKGKKGA